MSTIPLEFVATETRQGVAVISYCRTQAANALNGAAVEQLRYVFREAAADDGVRAIVITGSGKYFCTGSDIPFAVRHMEAGNYQRIFDYARAVHVLYNIIDQCPKPVLAFVNGAAWGAGLELALACDRIVASDAACLAFPETGLGIFPSTGGTQRTPRRIGCGLAKWLIFSGKILPASQAEEMGLIDQLIDGDKTPDWADVNFEPSGSPRDFGKRSTRFDDLASFFQKHRLEVLLRDHSPLTADPQWARVVRPIRGKAPLALRTAEKLINESLYRPLSVGLECELEELEKIFPTQDAYEGLSTVGRRRPEFIGR